MELGVASWSLILLSLAIHLQSISVDGESELMPSIFYKMESLIEGTKKPVYLPKKPLLNSHLLPRNEAESLPPITSRHLSDIMRTFKIHPRSAMAASVRGTIMICDSPGVKGETKFCATSMEAMLDFVFKALGVSEDDENRRPTLLSSRFDRSNHGVIDYQNYTIVAAPVEIPAANMVGCHVMEYPHAVLYCHTQEGGNKVYRIMMRGDEDGGHVDAYVACHLDTWHWDKSHPVFNALGTRPGDPACHVFPPHGNFLWIQNNIDKASSASFSSTG